MNFSAIDWIVLLVPLAVVIAIGIKTRAYIKGVSDFLAAGRAGGRYLVCSAEGMAMSGAISYVAIFEQIYKSGFALWWWQTLVMPTYLFIALSGFIIYRYRETRALTMAEFFEIRYSRAFRIFMGILAWVSGILNFGIFPAVSARFFVHFCGFPTELNLLGTSVPTYAALMLVLMPLEVMFVLLGGQLTALVTDCVEGLISGVMLLIISCVLLFLFPWDRISNALSSQPPGQSLLHPFDATSIPDFNIWWVLIAVGASAYNYKAWQGNQGFNASALNPHEARMGGILGQWRQYVRIMQILLIGVCAYTFLHDAAPDSAPKQALEAISEPQIREQMQVPTALGHMLPDGLRGMIGAVILFAMIACDASYMHSWGSIFIQDVVMPFRKTRPSISQHLRMLRYSIMGVAGFAFVFSLIFRQTDYILMFMAITGAIYLGGAGSVIIGGLYWKKGTKAAAWSAMIVGSGLAVVNIVIQQIDPDFPINGQYAYGIAMLAAIVIYITVSFLTHREDFNMEKMLHRGKYAIAGDHPATESHSKESLWRTLFGVDRSLRGFDLLQSVTLSTWMLFWFAVFIVVTVWNLIDRWPEQWWSVYWKYIGTWLPIGVALVTTVWFTFGGVRDLRKLFVKLRSQQIDPNDDGVVASSPVNQAGETAEPVLSETRN